jgi:hypothetical protein
MQRQLGEAGIVFVARFALGKMGCGPVVLAKAECQIRKLFVC